jgi:hypothetical protein
VLHPPIAMVSSHSPDTNFPEFEKLPGTSDPVSTPVPYTASSAAPVQVSTPVSAATVMAPPPVVLRPVGLGDMIAFHPATVAPDNLTSFKAPDFFNSTVPPKSVFAPFTANSPFGSVAELPATAPRDAIALSHVVTSEYSSLKAPDLFNAPGVSMSAAPSPFESSLAPASPKIPYQNNVLQNSAFFNFAVTSEMSVAGVPNVSMPVMDELSALSGNAALSARAQETLNAALAGKASAMNEVIDGMLNDRFGFEENRELAIKLTKQLAESGDVEGRLKLAYMQYQGSFDGVEYNPKAALATIKDLGRSWVGGEGLLSKAGVAAKHAVAAATESISENVPDSLPASIVIDPEEVIPANSQESIACVINEPADAQKLVFNCAAETAPFVEGNFITLKRIFNDGVESIRQLLIRDMNGMSKNDYLSVRLFEAASRDPANH